MADMASILSFVIAVSGVRVQRGNMPLVHQRYHTTKRRTESRAFFFSEKDVTFVIKKGDSTHWGKKKGTAILSAWKEKGGTFYDRGKKSGEALWGSPGAGSF